jgi:hypothetical protein
MKQSVLTENTPGSAGRPRATKREVVLVVVAVIALLLAVVGFVLYNGALVPTNAAAKVNDSYLGEDRVAAEIAQHRKAYRLEDDTDFANGLLAQNLNVSSFRQNIINQLALSDLISKRADELGITFTDQDAQAQVDAIKQSMAFNDDELWSETLATYGLSVDSLRSQYLVSLKQQAVFEADVAKREPTAEEELAYIKKYLVNTTQKHANRILFTGDDAKVRAQECYERLRADAERDGGITTEAFATYVSEYSDEEGAAATGGAFAWSGSNAMSEDVMTLLENLPVGSFSAPQSVEADGALEIIYCDEEYTFPAADAITPDAVREVPQALKDLIDSVASEALWTEDCSAYMAKLLLDARITYYPIPDNASYAVNMALASSQ